MIRALTSTYIVDLDPVTRLNAQLGVHGVDHYIFVEQRDYEQFAARFPTPKLRVKPDQGEGGLGRSGSLCRWHCHRQMLDVATAGDTIVNIDSDVFFVRESMIEDLACAAGETKGFTGTRPLLQLINGESFYSMSGMIIAAAEDVYRRAMSLPEADIWGICQLLMDSGHGCSEDVVAAYLYQAPSRGAASAVVHLDDKYSRTINGRLPKVYDRTDVDVIA